MSVIKSLLILNIVVFICTYTALCQLPQFVQEKIEITIEDDYCRIEGDYYFRNNFSSTIKRQLFYPFPIDSTMFYPDSVKVTDLQKSKNITFITAKTGIYFPIEISPQKILSYKVIYWQKITNNKIEYILTTTHKWGRALEKAEFVIKLPEKYELKFLSYKYNEIEEINNSLIYKIHKENFLPKRNLIVQWTRRKK